MRAFEQPSSPICAETISRRTVLMRPIWTLRFFQEAGTGNLVFPASPARLSGVQRAEGFQGAWAETLRIRTEPVSVPAPTLPAPSSGREGLAWAAQPWLKCSGSLPSDSGERYPGREDVQAGSYRQAKKAEGKTQKDIHPQARQTMPRSPKERGQRKAWPPMHACIHRQGSLGSLITAPRRCGPSNQQLGWVPAQHCTTSNLLGPRPAPTPEAERAPRCSALRVTAGQRASRSRIRGQGLSLAWGGRSNHCFFLSPTILESSLVHFRFEGERG